MRGFLRGAARQRHTRSCARHYVRFGIDLFIDEEGGYTTVSVACALLASLALVFALAEGIWAANRSADIQSVADSCALSAEQTTKAFTTCAQVVDATVLSLGLTGVFVFAAGLVTTLIPGCGGIGVTIVKTGTKIMDARDTFAKTSAEGLQALEKTLPYAQAANAYATASANSEGAAQYVGIAIPFPQVGHSDFGVGGEVSSDEINKAAEKNKVVSDKAKEAKDEVDSALHEGWEADNVDNPMCAYSRARDLAHLSDNENKQYASPEEWSFGAALMRARTYYAARAAEEVPSSGSVEERSNSAIRSVFYDFALKQVNAGSFIDDGETLEVNLPELPRNTATTKTTSLYTDSLWPCTEEDGARVLHAYADCPGAKGAASGWASLQTLDHGGCKECSVCKMNTAALGKVAQASTAINNGYEYYWRKIVEASKKWERATKDYKKFQDELQEEATQDNELLDYAFSALAVPRPKLFPPGAYGCIAVVTRKESSSTPTLLATDFSSDISLPSGVAIAGSTLAPDEATAENNVLSRFFDYMAKGEDGGIPGVLSGITTLWGNLLVSYNQSAGAITDAGEAFLNTLSGVGLKTPAAWLLNSVSSLVASAGFAPADLRIRKAVLCNTQNILDADGTFDTRALRKKIESIPFGGSAQDLLAYFGLDVKDFTGGGCVTLAELTLPGTDISVPITINLDELWSGS